MADPAEERTAGERLTSLHIQQAIRNDRESVAWLVSRFTPLFLCQAQQRMSPSLRRFCDPDDVVADVWMTVLAALPDLTPANGSFSLGLIRFASTVLIRRARDLVEKYLLGKPGIVPIDAPGSGVELPSDTRGVIAHVVAEERKGRVWASLDQLAPEDREIMVLRGIEGRSHGEVAGRIGLTPENCAVRYHRTLKRMRALVPASVLDDLEDA